MAVLTQGFDDDAGLVDGVTIIAAFVVGVTDTAGLVDSSTPVAGFAKTVTDTAGLVDTSTRVAGFASTATDAAGLVDTSTRTTGFVSSTSDSTGKTDTSSVLVAWAIITTDPAGLLDVYTDVFNAIRVFDDPLGSVDDLTGVPLVPFLLAAGDADYAPGSSLATIAGGGADVVVTLQIDGVGSQTVTLDATGALANFAVQLGTLTAGAHVLTAAGGGKTGSATFTVRYARSAPAAGGTLPTPAAASAGRWQLQDPVDASLYVFTFNPSTEGAPFAPVVVSDQRTTTGQPVSTQGAKVPVTWELTGYLETQAQTNDLAAWARKPHPVWITDDLGRVFTVILAGFVPILVAAGRAGDKPYRAKYTLSAELLASA